MGWRTSSPTFLYDDAEFLEANREAINVRVRDLQ